MDPARHRAGADDGFGYLDHAMKWSTCAVLWLIAARSLSPISQQREGNAHISLGSESGYAVCLRQCGSLSSRVSILRGTTGPGSSVVGEVVLGRPPSPPASAPTAQHDLQRHCQCSSWCAPHHAGSQARESTSLPSGHFGGRRIEGRGLRPFEELFFAPRGYRRKRCCEYQSWSILLRDEQGACWVKQRAG